MATVNNNINDKNDLVKYLQSIRKPGQITELRVFNKSGKVSQGGYFDFDHLNNLAQTALGLSGKAQGLYITVNLPNPEVIHRAYNTTNPYPGDLTKNGDIITRVEIPIDMDAKRPTGISATAAEHDAAIAKMYQVAEYLKLSGVIRKNRILINSGNGAHIRLCINEPESPEIAKLIKKCLLSLDAKFSDKTGRIRILVDTSVENAARVIKLPFTMACKGSNTVERPHRLSTIIDQPDTLEPLSLDLLKTLAFGVPEPPKRESTAYQGNGQPLDFPKWAQDHGVTIRGESQDGSATKYIVSCPFNSEHDKDSPAVFQDSSGKLGFNCFHNGCDNKTWQDYRIFYEPDAYERKSTYQQKKRVTTNTVNNPPASWGASGYRC